MTPTPFMKAPPAGRRRKASAGVTLIEMGVVLAIITIIIGYGLSIITAAAEREAIETTRERLMAIEEALILYAARNKRLPCPADNSLGREDANAGLGQDGSPDGDPAGDLTRNCATGIVNSGVPWRELGIGQGVSEDGWRRRISYFVFDGNTGLTRTDGLDMSLCKSAAYITVANAAADCTEWDDVADGDPCVPAANCNINPNPDAPACPFGECARHPEAFLAGKGLTLWPDNADDAPADSELMAPADWQRGGGAAFVLVSHGIDGAGAYLRSGTRQAVPTAERRQVENTDADGDYTDAPIAAGDTVNADRFFDDLVRAMTIHELAERANLGPE